MTNSHAQQVREIKAVLEQMKISERQWAKESSKAPGLPEAQKNHPSAQSKTQTKET
jgi:hypothetical protein